MTTATTTWKGWRHIVGKVYATVVIENAHDARVGRIPSASVRRVVIEQMMADTGASHPFLPRDLIDRLGPRVPTTPPTAPDWLVLRPSSGDCRLRAAC